MKPLKFAPNLVPLVLSDAKTTTWRLFDDKDLQQRDELALINKETREQFATARIIAVSEKPLRELDDADLDGHEPYENEEKMLEDFRKYYGERVTLESVVKIIKFELEK